MRKSRVDDGGRNSRSVSKVPVLVKRSSSTLGQRSSERRSVSEDRGGAGFKLKKTTLPLPLYSHQRRQRSNSATPMRTPGQQHRSSAISSVRKTPVTDKKRMNDILGDVFNYLGQIDGLDKNFVASRDIKMMTIKDFLRIVCHLAKFWTSKVSFTNNYIDEIYEMLMTLHYPYNFNKSWLKTPNAPHAINHIAVMISWLLQGVPEESTCDPAVESDNFPSTAFATFFDQKVQEGYRMWNNNQDHEVEGVKREIINEFICESVNFTSESALLDHIKELEEGVGELVKDLKVWQNKKDQVDGVKNLLEEKKREKAELQSEIEQKTRELAVNREQYIILQKALVKTRDLAKKTRAEWQLQKKENHVGQHDKLVNIYHDENIHLQSLKEHEDQVQEIGFTVQVERSRLLKKAHDVANKVNLMLHRISINCPSEMTFNDLSLDPTAVDDLTKIPLIKDRLKIIEKYLKNYQKKQIQRDQLKTNHELGQKMKLEREQHLAKLQEKLHDLKSKRDRQESTIKYNIDHLNEKIKGLEKSHSDLTASISSIEEKLETEKKKHQALVEYFTKEADKELEAKDKLIEELDAACEFFENKFKSLGFDTSHMRPYK